MITIKTMKDIPTSHEIPSLHHSKPLGVRHSSKDKTPIVRVSAVELRRQKLSK